MEQMSLAQMKVRLNELERQLEQSKADHPNYSIMDGAMLGIARKEIRNLREIIATIEAQQKLQNNSEEIED